MNFEPIPVVAVDRVCLFPSGHSDIVLLRCSIPEFLMSRSSWQQSNNLLLKGITTYCDPIEAQTADNPKILCINHSPEPQWIEVDEVVGHLF